jgi:hypothetical protein
MDAERLSARGGETDRDEPERRITRVQWFGLMLFVISVAAYYSIARWPPPAAPLTGAIEIARPPSPSGSPTPATARVEAPTTGSCELSAADATTGDLLHLDVRSQGLCWLSATVDGTRVVVYRLMQAGERHTIEMRRSRAPGRRSGGLRILDRRHVAGHVKPRKSGPTSLGAPA